MLGFGLVGIYSHDTRVQFQPELRLCQRLKKKPDKRTPDSQPLGQCLDFLHYFSPSSCVISGKHQSSHHCSTGSCWPLAIISWIIISATNIILCILLFPEVAQGGHRIHVPVCRMMALTRLAMLPLSQVHRFCPYTATEEKKKICKKIGITVFTKQREYSGGWHGPSCSIWNPWKEGSFSHSKWNNFWLDFLNTHV